MKLLYGFTWVKFDIWNVGPRVHRYIEFFDFFLYLTHCQE